MKLHQEGAPCLLPPWERREPLQCTPIRFPSVRSVCAQTMTAAPIETPVVSAPARAAASACAGVAAEIALVHGWAMSPRVYAALEASLHGQVVRTLALPGHEGAPPIRAARLEDWADALAAGLADASVLVGWSLGAMLALDIACRHPHKVSRLVLLAGTARFVADDTGWPGLQAEVVDAFQRDYASAPAATLARFLALQCIGEPRRRVVQQALAQCLSPGAQEGLCAGQAADDGLRPGVGRSAAPNPFEDGLAILAAADLRPLLGGIRQPVLLLHGDQDALMPVAAAYRLAQALPQARLQVLEGSGHALPVSRAADCAGHILAFVGARGDA